MYDVSSENSAVEFGLADGSPTTGTPKSDEKCWGCVMFGTGIHASGLPFENVVSIASSRGTRTLPQLSRGAVFSSVGNASDAS
jgi:hypothetical protein